jgi:hypothetical protein
MQLRPASTIEVGRWCTPTTTVERSGSRASEQCAQVIGPRAASLFLALWSHLSAGTKNIAQTCANEYRMSRTIDEHCLRVEHPGLNSPRAWTRVSTDPGESLHAESLYPMWVNGSFQDFRIQSLCIVQPSVPPRSWVRRSRPFEPLCDLSRRDLSKSTKMPRSTDVYSRLSLPTSRDPETSPVDSGKLGLQ